MSVRHALPADLPVIRQTLEMHARTEASMFRDEAAVDELENVLFGPDAFVQVTIAERPDRSAPAFAGLAMWYRTFSSWARTSGIWLEDLYVVDSFRKAGVGRELMDYLRTQTEGRIEWDVTLGNDGAERFYARLGAVALPDVTRFRWVADDPLQAAKL
ncbi:MAG TPA: GNAT family N-acetyltransferase [Solirubrobacteraceae bacterium]|nr:GNAT family N-acetyltransferase [Solirubrobacteraceae bacterium]